MPSLLFGTHPQRVERGRFTCPGCATAFAYERIVVRRTFRLLGRPLFAVGRLGEYVECSGCSGTYRPEVLAYDAGDETSVVMAEYQRVVKRLLALESRPLAGGQSLHLFRPQRGQGTQLIRRTPRSKVHQPT